MVTKQDVIDLHRRKPLLTARELAAELDCAVEQIFIAKHRYGLKIPRSRGRTENPNSILALGREAKSIGLTVDMIQRMAKA